MWYQIGHASALKYDGEGFVAALEKALELGAPEALVYPELAFQTTQRAGMWKRRLDDSLVEGWIERALAVAPQGTPARMRALAARARVGRRSGRGAVGGRGRRRAGRRPSFARKPWVRYRARSRETGQLDEALDVAVARTELLPLITDPDQLADALTHERRSLYAGFGRLSDARAMVEQLEEASSGLTPHHRVHALGTRMRLECAVGGWDAVRGRVGRAEEAVEANLATPCPFNVGLPANGGAGHGAWRRTGGGELGCWRRRNPSAWSATRGSSRQCHGTGRRPRGSATKCAASWIRLSCRVLHAWRMGTWAVLLDGLAMLGERERVEADAPSGSARTRTSPHLRLAPWAWSARIRDLLVGCGRSLRGNGPRMARRADPAIGGRHPGMTDVEVRPLTADRWEDLVELFGPSGAFSNCWCTWWRQTGGEFDRGIREHGAGNRALLRAAHRRRIASRG